MNSKTGMGIVTIGIGLIQIVGSVTGNEAAMLAALFDPSLLSTKSGSPVTHSPSIGSTVTGGFWSWVKGVLRIPVVP